MCPVKILVTVVLISCSLSVSFGFPSEDLGNKDLSHSDELGINSVYSFFESCGEKDIFLCMKMRALTYVDRALRKGNEVKILDGVSVVPVPGKFEEMSRELNGRALSEDELDANLPEDADEKDTQVETLLIDRVLKFFGSRSLQLKVPEEAITDVRRSLDEARKKKKKKLRMLLPILLLMKLKAAALIPLALGGLALISLKALVIGKLALVLSAIVGLQKLLGNRNSSQTYEVVAHPHYTHSHVNEEHGHYARSLQDPQQLAYNAYADQKNQD